MPIPGRRRAITGHRGILTTSSIQYNNKSFNLLGRGLEYTFWIEPVREYRGTEVSLQLYRNDQGFWRLFAYTRAGMLLSLNLSLTRRKSTSILELGQTIAMRAREFTVSDRQRRADEASRYLRKMVFDVSEARQLVFGTFGVQSGAFLDVTAPGFVANFLQAALIVGHFQGNKGYLLPYPRGEALGSRRTSSVAALRRRISPGLRSDVFERDNFTCQKCFRSPRKHGVILHVDHKKPWSLGGPTEFSNLWTLCSRHNLQKGNRYDDTGR